jgi:hypothetical protein
MNAKETAWDGMGQGPNSQTLRRISDSHSGNYAAYFYDIALGSPHVIRRSGGIYHLNHQGKKFSRARNQRAADG